MSLVTISMRRPITVVVVVVATALAAFLVVRRMPRDIFPDMGTPVIYVAQPFGGMDPAQMEGFLVNYYEYHFLYITGIEHVESKSIQGAGLVKLQFHEKTDMAQAMAETIGYVNRARAFMPPGTVPPFVMRFDAGSIPVGNLVFSSETKSVREMQDLALNRVRPLFATLPGVSAPPPFGASQRSIVIRVNPDRLRAYDMTPDEVVNALASANAISASGNVRIGDFMPMVPVNSVVGGVKELESVPIRTGSLETVFVHDIGTVEDSADIQTGFALVNGRRTVYIPVTKRADASTLDVVDLVKENMPKFRAVLPDDVAVDYRFDQSPLVTRAIKGLAMEGLLGAVLTGLMVLLFLRDVRSAVIIVLNIPLSLTAALLALAVTKATVNIMTLGGLALAVGILVDEATVSIENIHTHLGRGSGVPRAARDATNETAVPRLLAMLCILAVFIPSLFMTGAGRALFVPLSLAVGFSMVASYLLSSTLVPILAVWLLKAHGAHEPAKAGGMFERVRSVYGRVAAGLVRIRHPLLSLYVLAAGFVIWIAGGRLGTEIFPSVDTGQFQLRLRARAGTRIERTEAIALKTLEEISDEVGPGNVDVTLGFVGVQPPSYPINTIHLWTAGPEEAVLQVAIRREARIPVAALKERLRTRLPAAMPDVWFSFEPGDIVSRVMSLGSPAPVEVAVSGPNVVANRAFAEKVRDGLAEIGSMRDIGFGQAVDTPAVQVDIDRRRAGIMGITAAEAARSLLTATSSSRFVVPNFWADPTSGVGYQVQVEIPQNRMDSLEAVRNVPVARREGAAVSLRNIANVTAKTATGEYDRYNMQRMITVNANIAGEDLGHASRRIAGALTRIGDPPPKVNVAVRGQIVPLEQMLEGLRTGLGLTVVVIFLLLAAYFQSIRLALAVISTVPAVISGVIVALSSSHTTLNVQSFTGAIMAIGVALANAILLVTFAAREQGPGVPPPLAAVNGARSRLRPILMTSFAMVAGMLPMALGLGEGGGQTEPLGRAVVGGLAAGTLFTLFVLPAVFTAVMGGSSPRVASLDPDDPSSPRFEGSRAAT